MSDVERQIAAFLHEEADRAELSAGMYQRVLRRARAQRAATAAVAGLAVIAIAISGVVMAAALRSPSSIGPAQPKDAPPVNVTSISVLFGDQVATTDDAVWVGGGGELHLFDPRTNEPGRAVLGVPGVSGGMAVGEGSIWMASWQGDMGPGGGTPPRGKVVRVDLGELDRRQGDVSFEEVGQIIWRSGQNEAPEGVVTGFGSAWVVEELGDRLLRFSPDGELLAEIPVGNTPVDAAVGEGGVWVVHTRSDPKHYGKADASLLKVDPADGATSEAVPAGTCPHSVTTGGSAVWVLDYCDEAVRKFDPQTMQLLGVADLPSAATDLAVGEGYLWTIHPEKRVILRLDLEGLNQVGEPIRLGNSRGYFASVVHGAGSIWVSARKLFRLDVEPPALSSRPAQPARRFPINTGRGVVTLLAFTGFCLSSWGAGSPLAPGPRRGSGPGPRPPGETGLRSRSRVRRSFPSCSAPDGPRRAPPTRTA